MAQCERFVLQPSVAPPGTHVLDSKDSAIARATVSRRIEQERSINFGVQMIDQRHEINLVILSYKKK